MRFTVFTLLYSFILITLSFPVFADEKGIALSQEITDIPKALEKKELPPTLYIHPARDNVQDSSQNNRMDRLKEKTDLVVKGLGEDELRVLYNIRQSFGITRSVGIVRDLVSNTVTLCGEENPGLKTEIDNRFNAWSTAIAPVLKESEDIMQKSIDKQQFREPDEIRNYLHLVKEAADFTDSKIEKIPVTTKDACMNLLESMNDTEKHLIRLMKELMIPADIANKEVVE